MSGLYAVSVVLAQAASIGSALSEGIGLVYESGGVVQAPWVYDSVHVVARGEFDRCIVTQRRSQAVRESCVRGDTLFERTASGTYRPVRPIGPNMQLEVRSASGDILRYTTGDVEVRRLAARLDVTAIPTSVVTRDPDGTVTRRLREHYAPSLLTAIRGVFEEPDASGGWRSVREFSLNDVVFPGVAPSDPEAADVQSQEVEPAPPGASPSPSLRRWCRGGRNDVFFGLEETLS